MRNRDVILEFCSSNNIPLCPTTVVLLKWVVYICFVWFLFPHSLCNVAQLVFCFQYFLKNYLKVIGKMHLKVIGKMQEQYIFLKHLRLNCWDTTLSVSTTVHLLFKNKDMLHNHSAIIKIRKLTLTYPYHPIFRHHSSFANCSKTVLYR